MNHTAACILYGKKGPNDLHPDQTNSMLTTAEFSIFLTIDSWLLFVYDHKQSSTAGARQVPHRRTPFRYYRELFISFSFIFPLLRVS